MNKNAPNRSSIMAKSTITAAAGLSMAASLGEGAIIYTAGNVTLNAGNAISTINMNNPGSKEFYLYWRQGGAAQIRRASISGSLATAAGAAINFASGASITAGFGFAYKSENIFKYVANATGGEPTPGFQGSRNFNAASPGYLGIKFNDNGTKYGWIHIDSIAADGTSYHINGWAYEDSGGSIRAGDTGQGGSAVPEPSGLALLACGAAGIYALRKKRNGHVSDSKNV